MAAINNERIPLLSSNGNVPAWKAIQKEICSGQQRLWAVTLFSVLAASTSLLAGYTLGFPSSALLDLRGLNDSRTFKHDKLMEGLFGAMSPIGATFGGLIAGWSADGLGRKPSLLLTAVPSTMGWSAIGATWFIKDKLAFDVIILIGRFLTGFGIGWSMFCAPVYIAEVSSPALRGLFSSLPLFVMNIGILLVYGLGMVSFIKFHHTAFIAAIISVVIFLATIIMPESPRFLIMKKNTIKAMNVIKLLRGPKGQVNEEFEEISYAVSMQTNLSFFQVMERFKKREVWLPFILLTFIMFFRQFSGINALIFYADPILKKAGLKHVKFIALMTVGVAEVVLTFISILVVDLFGRKILLVVSALIMCISSGGLGVSSYFDNDCLPCPSMNYLMVASLALFIIGVSIGFDSIPYILIPELIPLDVRGVLGGILSAFHWLCAVFVAGLYLLSAGFDGAATWWTFAFFNLTSFAFVAAFLPETKGKKLESVTKELSPQRYKLCS